MRHKLVLLLLILLIGGVYLFTATRRAILDDGDALYATVAREMLSRGDWVTPYANGVRFLDKPPLMYWAMALSYGVFGVTEFAARLPSVLAVLGCAALLYLMARKVGGETAGITAALAVSLCVGTFLFTRMVFPDMLFVFFFSLALFGFIEWYTRENPPAWPALLFYGACAGGVLAKGLIGLVFPVAVVLAFMLVNRDLRRLRCFYPVLGSALFVVLSAPWHFLIAQRTPGFLWYYFVNEHFLRFLGKRQPHDYETIPLALFWGLVLIWFFPWSVFLPALSRLVRSGAVEAPTRAVVQLCFVWVAVIGLFFSISSRIEHYALPVFPPLALLVGVAMCLESGAEYRSDTSRLRWNAGGFVFLAVLGSMIALALLGAGLLWTLWQGGGAGETGSRVHAYQYYFAPVYDLPQEVRARLKLPLVGVGATMSLGLVAAWFLNRRGRLRAAVLVLGTTAGAFCLFAYQSLGICEQMLSSKQFATVLRDTWRPGDRVVVAGDFETANSINFYTDAPLEIHGGTAAVLQWGTHYADAPKVILTREEFDKSWAGPARVFVLAVNERIPSLALGRFYLLLQSAGRTLLSNRPPEPPFPPAAVP